MAMNLPQLLKRTPKHRIEGAQYVKLTKLKLGYDKDGFAIAYCQSYSTHHVEPDGSTKVSDTRYRYVTYIKFVDNKLNVNASCSCPDWMYRWEYALHQKGAANIEYSNGQAPTATNPTLRPGVCKHMVKLLQTIKSKVPTVKK